MTRFFLYISYMMVLTVSIYVILASIYHEKANDWVITGFNQTHRNIRSYINRTLTEQPVKEPKPVGDAKAVGDGKSVGVCVVTAFQKPKMKELFTYDNYEKIIPYTMSNMWNYCKHNNYRFYMFNQDVFDLNRKSSWVKIPLFRKYFNMGCDWVFYTDVDWLFVTKDPLPLDDAYDIIVSNECIKGNEWKKMSGSFLLKKSKWSIDFLTRWDNMYEKYKHVMNHDQTAFEDMFRNIPKEMKVLPPEQFMTYDTRGCPKPGFGIHFPDGNKFKRIQPYISGKDLSVVISNRVVNYQVPFYMGSTVIVIGVLSSDKTKRMVMRDKYKNIYFIVGKKNGKFDYEEFYTYNDMIFIDMEEAYMGEDSILPYKTQTFLHVVHVFVKSYNYILKIDDDSLVNMDKLRKELDRVQPDYWGRVWYNNVIDRDPKSKWYVSRKTYPQSVYPNYCSGAGYVLSYSANECIVSKLSVMKFMPREDVATGILAGKCGVSPVNSNKIQHMKPYNSNDYIIRHYYDFNKPVAKPKSQIVRLTPKGNFMFGYYDQLQDNIDSSKILVAKIPFYNREPTEKDSIEIGWVHSNGEQEFHKIGTSRAWNLQTGAMAEWIDINKVVYNDRRDNTFVAIVKNIITGVEIVHSRARFCGKDKFISISFSRLHNLRRGYGYTVPLVNDLEKIPSDDGIWVDNKLILSYKTLSEFIKQTDGVDKYTNLRHPNRFKHGMYWWVNHIMKSRDKNRISFILRGTTLLHGHSYQFSSLMIYDFKDGLWRVPLRGSHPYYGSYLINCEDSGAYKIQYKKSVQRMNWQTDGDGHCSLSSDEQYILSDTYPRPKKKLFITNIKNDKKTYFGQYSPSKEGPIFTRCDLHPKMARNMKYITFDSTHEGFRGVYMAHTKVSVKPKVDIKKLITNMRRMIRNKYRGNYVHPGSGPVRVVTRNEKASDASRMGGNYVGGNLYPALWTWLAKIYDVKSILDVGCGIGESTYVLNNMGFDTTCVEGYSKNKELSKKIFGNDINFISLDFEHNYYRGSAIDMIWCSEVAEHVPPEFIDNFMKTMAKSRVVAGTFPPPGTEGHNHVNLQTKEWWIAKYKEYGFDYDEKNTFNSYFYKKEYNRGHDWWKTHHGMIFVKSKKKKYLKHSYVGGQGNQIWQYLALKGIAEKQGFILCGNSPKYITIMSVNQPTTCPNIKYRQIRENNQKILKIPNDDSEIVGYLQYEEYFGTETIQNFKIKTKYVSSAEKILSECSEWIGLHVRVFPDTHFYEERLNHGVVYDDILYELNVKYPDSCLYVASNDMSKINKKYKFKKVIYSTNEGSLDITVLTRVHHLVVSTGSFAYIAATKNIYQDIYYHKDQNYLMGYDKTKKPPNHWNQWGFKKYSQAQQDLMALALSSSRNNGYFVEIGANDGKTFSNTLMLENMGWRGLLIEASPTLCKKNPRKAKWYCGCLSEENSIKFKTDGTLGHISSTGDTVPCTNPSIFNEKIDFFSLDVEGAEMNILNMMKPYLMNSTVQVNMWSIEYRVWDKKIFYKETLEKLTQIREFFKDIGGYTEHGVVSNIPINGFKDGLDIIFVKTILLPQNIESVQINIGSSVDPISGKDGVHTLIFEPIVPDEAATFAKNNDIKYGGTSKVYPYAVSNYTGDGVMFKYNEKGMSSSFSKPQLDKYWNTDATRGDGKQITVKTISLMEILKSIDKRIIFVKTDMQGYDFTAFLSSGSLLNKIDKIQTEVYTGPPTYKHVRNDMCRDWIPFMKKWGWYATNFDGKCNIKRELDIIWKKN